MFFTFFHLYKWYQNAQNNTDNVTVLQSRVEFLEQCKETKQNWTEPENFGISFCVIFDHHEEGFISGRETGH